jgi:mannose-6-phosphate isomerase-like protein (cupin superfamily)
MTMPEWSRRAGMSLFFLVPLSALAVVPAIRSDGERAAQEACPGERMPSVLATGIYQSRPVPAVVINGEPWSGAYWEPGMRSYWHCHSGGQLLVVWEGEGRVQTRGERARTVARGQSQLVGPGEEHWHGAVAHAHAQYLQVSIQPAGTLWMEEVGRDDYLGNDIGIASRDEFLRTGVREKPEGLR